MSRLPTTPTIPGRLRAETIHSCLSDLLEAAPELYSALFLRESLPSGSAGNTDNARESEASIEGTRSSTISFTDWTRLHLNVLADAGLVHHKRIGKEQVSFRGCFGIAPIGEGYAVRFLVSDVIDEDEEFSVFPAHKFMSQFTFHLKRLFEFVKSTDEVLDLGAGSGAYGIGLAPILRPPGRVVMLDINPRALELARFNVAMASTNGVITPLCGDMLNCSPNQSFDVIVSNPPYVALPDDYNGFAPIWAVGGPDGMKYIRHVVRSAHDLLRPQGRLSLVVCVLGTKDLEGVIKEIVGEAPALELVQATAIHPPMWSGLHLPIPPPNPAPLRDLYSQRFIMTPELDRWVTSQIDFDHGFVHNAYIELIKV